MQLDIIPVDWRAMKDAEEGRRALARAALYARLEGRAISVEHLRRALADPTPAGAAGGYAVRFTREAAAVVKRAASLAGGAPTARGLAEALRRPDDA
jgi:hypothetical protein